MKHLLLTLLLAPLTAFAQSSWDAGAPFGFATATSRTDAGAVANITGGGDYKYPVAAAGKKVITLRALGQGKDDRAQIDAAIKANDIVIFDGSAGDFTVSSIISVKVSNRTLLGINNARLCTKWYVTPEIKAAFDQAGVKGASTSDGTGGTLSNGATVKEEAEYLTRKTLLELTGDKSEAYRKSGIFDINGCRNIIVRNLSLVGPGSIDCGGYDLISVQHTTNFWIDHCTFTDGIDGNCDITNQSDFGTVSWCLFQYTSRSYVHQNTNLCGSSDSATGDDSKLDITFAYNEWGTGCKQRMPMARMGRFHLLNNYYNCAGASSTVNPRKNSEFLIEGNFFDAGVKNVFSQSESTAYVWRNNVVKNTSPKTVPSSDRGTCPIAYPYTARPAADVPDKVHTFAGATYTAYPTAARAVQAAMQNTNDTAYTLSGLPAATAPKGTIVVQHGRKHVK